MQIKARLENDCITNLFVSLENSMLDKLLCNTFYQIFVNKRTFDVICGVLFVLSVFQMAGVER